ncbi:MAG TPA: hypothetical protein ENN08_07725 [Bacteroidales bacterium]|nr:hypothetical protein [Bacteroidales bacterium]
MDKELINDILRIIQAFSESLLAHLPALEYEITSLIESGSKDCLGIENSFDTLLSLTTYGVADDLFMRISDYKGAITYKKWFDKNFPNDIGGPLLSLNWSIAYSGLGHIKEAKIYTIDTAFQNIYLHGLLLDREVSRIDMYEHGYDMLEYAKSMIMDYKKVSTQPYLYWLRQFMDTDDYKAPVNKVIALSELLKNENNRDKRIKLLNHIRDIECMNKNRKNNY